mgnify:FL=1
MNKVNIFPQGIGLHGDVDGKLYRIATSSALTLHKLDFVGVCGRKKKMRYSEEHLSCDVQWEKRAWKCH